MSMCVCFFSSMEIYRVLIKNPAKTRRGRTTGTNSAPAISGFATAIPINAPGKQKIETLF